MVTCIQAPFFLERTLVFALWIAVFSGDYEHPSMISMEWFHGAVAPNAESVAKLGKPRVGFQCQPSSYVRLEAYGFFGLCEGA